MSEINLKITPKDIIGSIFIERGFDDDSTKSFLSKLNFILPELYFEAARLVPNEDLKESYIVVRNALDRYFNVNEKEN